MVPGMQRRRHASGLGEDGGEFVEQGRHKVITGANPEGWARRTRNPLPADPVISAPEGHGEGAEVP